MYVFDRYQAKVVEADSEIQRLKQRIRELETLKRGMRWAKARSPYAMVKRKQKGLKNGKA